MINQYKNSFGRMLRTNFLGIIFSCMLFTGSASGQPEWNVDISGGPKGIDGFHISVGDYYKAPKKEVVVIHERGIEDEELPVVYYISRRARVSPSAVVDLRLRGLSWMDVTLHYGLSPDIYYVPVTVVEEHHPHGHAYGYYKKHHKHHHWKKIRLEDRDIVNQVNLKFISDHYRCAPEKVIRYRSEGRHFREIDQDFKVEKYRPRAEIGGRVIEVSHDEREYKHDHGGKDRHHGKGAKHDKHGRTH